MFFKRQLQNLEEAGLTSSKENARDKVFSKTALFHEADFKLVDKRSIVRKQTQKSSKPSNVELMHEIEKSEVEAELTVALAEIDEYKKLMNRSTELSKLLKPSYLRTTQKSASLLARLNFWSDTLREIQDNKVVTC